MSDKDKIRQEIERRKGYISVTHFAEDLLAFIDSLPEDDPLNDPRFGEGFDAGRNVQKIFDEPKEMSDIKKQILTLLKQRHHSHKVALEQEKDPRSKHAIDLIARIREDSRLMELIDSLPEESCKDSLQVQETCKENGNKLPRYYGD